MVRACCLVGPRFVLWLRIFLSCCCCLIIILQVSGEEGVNIVFWFTFWSRSKWRLQSRENSLHAPFQRNTLLLLPFVTVEQGHVKKVYDLSVRLKSDFLWNFKPLDLNTLLNCFFFSMWLGVALHTEVRYRHHSTAPLHLDLWIRVLSVTASINRNQFPKKCYGVVAFSFVFQFWFFSDFASFVINS